MGRRGFAPKPTNLKVLEGKKVKTREARPNPITTPVCPAWLNRDAKIMWKRLVPVLTGVGLFTEADIEAFTAACQSWGIFVECERHLKKHGRVMEIKRFDQDGEDMQNSYFQQDPRVSIGNNALKNFKSFCI